MKKYLPIILFLGLPALTIFLLIINILSSESSYMKYIIASLILFYGLIFLLKKEVHLYSYSGALKSSGWRTKPRKDTTFTGNIKVIIGIVLLIVSLSLWLT